MEIYVSTLAFGKKDIEDTIRIAKEEDLALEFSSGLPYNEDTEKIYTEAEIKKIPHNYFPAPAIPFVLNLASSNPAIRNQSIQHCIKGLYLSKLANAPFFSAHAGFCIDPDPAELGRKINYSPDFDKQEHTALFLGALKTILDEAERLDMRFLIENNVIAAFNLVNGAENPLLCCENEEIINVLKAVNNSRLGLLLDTAHLKVSCQTLGIDKNNEVDLLEPYIKAIHHSDNDGFKDTNEPMGNEYWFLPYIKRFNGLPHVVEVKNIDIAEIKQQVKLLQTYGC